jgi:hypothetical protein
MVGHSDHTQPSPIQAHGALMVTITRTHAAISMKGGKMEVTHQDHLFGMLKHAGVCVGVCGACVGACYLVKGHPSNLDLT